MNLKQEFYLCEWNGRFYICKTGSPEPLQGSAPLNQHAVFLFRKLEKGVFSKEQLLHDLLAEYEMSTVLALNEIDTFLKSMKEYGIINE